MDQGGAMVLPLHVADEMRERGYEVETWYLYHYASAYDDAPGIRILFPRNATSLLDYLRVFFNLVGAMRRFRPDVVHGIGPLGNVFGTLAAWLIGCPVRVASQHNPAQTFHPLMRFLDRMLGTLGVYTGNIAVSDAVWDSYSTWPQSYLQRLQVIQNGTPRRESSQPKEDARARFDIPADAFVLGNVGRLAPQKNQMFLFDVLPELPDTHLVIAGDGELRSEYEAAIREKGIENQVHLLGSIPDSAMPEFYRALDVFVLPSEYEGLPIALIEAMQAELPIVASDIPPVCEVLLPEQGQPAGCILSTDDAGSWIESIRALKSRPEEAEKLAYFAGQRAKHFSMKRMADAYEDYFFRRGSFAAEASA
jgi:glycosyltransferase involved in cell wall biosynthesis